MVVSKVKLNAKTGNTLYRNVVKIVHLKDRARTIFDNNDGTRYGELPNIYRGIRDSEKVVLNIGKLLRETSDSEGDKIKQIKGVYNQLLRGNLGGIPKKELRNFIYMEDGKAGDRFTSTDLTEALTGGVTEFKFQSQYAGKLGSAQFIHLKEAVKTKPEKDYSKIIKELEVTAEPKDVAFDDSLGPVALDRSVSNPTEDPAKKQKDKRRKKKASGGAAEDAAADAAADAEAVDAEEAEAPGITMSVKHHQSGVPLEVLHHEGTSKPIKNPSLRKKSARDNAFAVLDEDAGIGGGAEGETITLEDDVDTLQAEEDINERENPAPSPPPTTGTPPPPDEPPVDPPVDAMQPPPPVNNRGTVPEVPNILDASRGGPSMTPSALLAVSSQEEDRQRNKATILRLKEEIRALHLIYDNNIKQFRENPHKAAKDDALKSKDIRVVRKHHKDMEGAVREYYRSGGGDSLQVGVIVPIDTYLSQYLNNAGNAERVERTTGTEGTTSLPPRPEAASTTEGRRRTTAEGGASATEGAGSTTAGASHRNPDLKSTAHDPYSRAISQGIYYQRGGMGSYRQQPVSGHTIRIGGKRPVTFTPNDPTKPRVDAPMQNFLNRPVRQKLDTVFKIKT